jgi:hypothetical protein
MVKTILSKPNWVANDDKLTLIKKLQATLKRATVQQLTDRK